MGVAGDGIWASSHGGSAPSSALMHPRRPHAILLSLVILAALPLGCQREGGPDLPAEVARLKTEAEDLRHKLGAAERNLEGRTDAVALAGEATATAKKQAVEKEELAAQKDAQIRALQAELAALKKSDALVFAEISGFQHQGLTTVALSRYEQFTRDYPQSPLVANALGAMTQLSSAAEREAKTRASQVSPKQREREVLKYLAEGTASVEEIAPLLKNKTPAEVAKLLGPPNRTYRNGTEFGYVDKVSDPAKGGKDTLVISFDEGKVSGLRAGYLGREIKP